ncbi:hypothetical protein SALBM135S_07066 [Streptomyces alboniger]
MIRELDVAFHAGNRGWNERSIGIEHEGFVDQRSSFTDEMYEASARLTAGICARYDFPVDREHIVGHVEVPARTTRTRARTGTRTGTYGWCARPGPAEAAGPPEEGVAPQRPGPHDPAPTARPARTRG